jgi:hypothetical protein
MCSIQTLELYVTCDIEAHVGGVVVPAVEGLQISIRSTRMRQHTSAYVSIRQHTSA